MSDIAIRLDGISKRYRIGRNRGVGTLRDTLTGFFRSQKNLPPMREYWALDEISCNIQRGEVLGLIGRNGSGKSTLLKIISRIMPPTRGSGEVRGRLAALLEVGTGFHGELTGRENVYLNGVILGMRTHEIRRRFDEIVAFSEIDQFLDTPVKYYSSGMYIRLAFAVAAHLDSDILIIDEVLAVGDYGFQKKCFGKMEEVSSNGRTVVVVSHNLNVMQRLCRQALWLDRGKMRMRGPCEEVLNAYQSEFTKTRREWVRSSPPGPNLSFQRVQLVSGNGPGALPGESPVTIEMEYEIHQPGVSVIEARLINRDGVVVLTTLDSDDIDAIGRSRRPGRYIARFEIPGDLLSPGNYSLRLDATVPNQSRYDVVDEAVVFEVQPSRSLPLWEHRGILCPRLSWETSELKVRKAS